MNAGKVLVCSAQEDAFWLNTYCAVVSAALFEKMQSEREDHLEPLEVVTRSGGVDSPETLAKVMRDS